MTVENQLVQIAKKHNGLGKTVILISFVVIDSAGSNRTITGDHRIAVQEEITNKCQMVIEEMFQDSDQYREYIILQLIQRANDTSKMD